MCMCDHVITGKYVALLHVNALLRNMHVLKQKLPQHIHKNIYGYTAFHFCLMFILKATKPCSSSLDLLSIPNTLIRIF